MTKPARTIGIISDTHGLLRDEALAALAGSERLIHAGDICDAATLDRLSRIAPVTAVRGNNDIDASMAHLPEIARLDIDGVRIVVIHDAAKLPADGLKPRADVVVCGHSHRPHAERRDGVLYVNPGSAGPRRFSLPIGVARLVIAGDRVEAELVSLEPENASPGSPRRSPGLDP